MPQEFQFEPEPETEKIEFEDTATLVRQFEEEFGSATATAKPGEPVAESPAYAKGESVYDNVRSGYANGATVYDGARAYGVGLEPDKDSIARASSLADALVDRAHILSLERPPAATFQQLFSDEQYRAYAEGAPIADVIYNCRQMADEFAFARHLETPIVCLVSGAGPIPVSYAQVSEGPGFRRGVFRNSDPDLFHDTVVQTIDIATAENKELRALDVDHAEESARTGLRLFLSFRFWGWKVHGEQSGYGGGWFRQRDMTGESAPHGGLTVRVFNLTPGLRIHVAPAYFIDDWLFFGHPSTPVEGPLMPGRYVFAADGPMLPRRRIDPGVFPIPPTLKVKLTRF